MKLNESLGLKKTASEDVYAAMIKAASRLDMSEYDVVGLFSELDPEIGILKEASDMGIDPYLYGISVGEAVSGNKELVKISAEKGADPYEVAINVIEKNFVPGEISKIAAKALYLYGRSNTEESFEKSASEIGMSPELIKVAIVALELSAEGASPEMLKEAADDAGIDYKQYAAHVLEGEKWALDKMASERLSAYDVDKIISSDEISEPFAVGVLNGFEKLSGIDRPEGVFEAVHEDLGSIDNSDLIADYYVKTGAAALGLDPDNVDMIYSYFDPDYAMEKYSARVPENYEPLAKIAINTLGRIGAAIESGEEFPEDSLEAIEKTASMFGESEEDISTRMFITANMMSGANPGDILKEASAYVDEGEDVMDGLEKMAAENVEYVVDSINHEKIASAGYSDLMEDIDDFMEKEASVEDVEYVDDEEYSLMKEATDMVVKARVDFNKAMEIEDEFIEKTSSFGDDEAGLKKTAAVLESTERQAEGLTPYSEIGRGVRAINNLLK